MAPKKYTLAQAEQALLKNYGNVSAAARSLGVAHPTLFDAIKKHERLQKAREQAQEQALDKAEHALLKAIDKGEGWAVCFLLKTIGKKRGYVEGREISNAPDNPFKVSIIGAVMGSGAFQEEEGGEYSSAGHLLPS